MARSGRRRNRSIADDSSVEEEEEEEDEAHEAMMLEESLEEADRCFLLKVRVGYKRTKADGTYPTSTSYFNPSNTDTIKAMDVCSETTGKPCFRILDGAIRVMFSRHVSKGLPRDVVGHVVATNQLHGPYLTRGKKITTEDSIDKKTPMIPMVDDTSLANAIEKYGIRPSLPTSDGNDNDSEADDEPVVTVDVCVLLEPTPLPTSDEDDENTGSIRVIGGGATSPPYQQ
jgi:hypothetical protein